MTSYSTSFATNEDPLSEGGGRWKNGGTDGGGIWHDMAVAGNICYGKQNGPSFSDGTAILTGTWGPNQYVRTHVSVTGRYDAQFPEVEHRFRSVLNATTNRGYEVTYSVAPANLYIDIVLWRGALGDFVILNEVDGLPCPVTGDLLESFLIGTVITTYLNGGLVLTYDTVSDLALHGAIWSDGNPGIGHNADPSDGTNNHLYGFTDFLASDLGGGVAVGDEGGWTLPRLYTRPPLFA